MFEKVAEAEFVRGEHDVLKFWAERSIFQKLRQQIAGKTPWSFLDGPITANNPMGVHHAWGRTYKDTFQRYWAMNGRDLRYQNGFDCQGLWVEVEVEKQLNLGAKSEIEKYGIDKFVHECKKRVLKYAAIQTEQSIRLGYWMEWDDPGQLRKLAAAIGTDDLVEFTPPKQPGKLINDKAEAIVAKLGNPDWGGSYYTFSTENNETIWTFLKKCFERSKVYRGYDVMPWSGRAGSAYSQMEVADGRKLTVHRSAFVRFPIISKTSDESKVTSDDKSDASSLVTRHSSLVTDEYLLVWTTTPWTLTSNVAAAVNPELDYVKLKAKRDGAIYYFAKDNLDFQRLATEFKDGFGREEWDWPKSVPKLKTLSQIFKENGGYDIEGTIKGADMIGWRYAGPFDDLPAQQQVGGTYEKWRLDAALAGHDLLTDFHVLIQHDFPRMELAIYSDVDDEFGQYTQSDVRVFVDNFPKTIARVLRSVQHGKFTAAIPDFPSLAKAVEFLRGLGLRVVETDDWKSCMCGLSATCDELKTALTSQKQILEEIANECANLHWRSAAQCHRVVDGGRDFKGNANVVAGEGTGIVHIAPGCGDVDHTLGMQMGMVAIAPLGEDGCFIDGFGEFTGKSATAPETVDLVFAKLKEKGYLVNVEQYPHIYPFCWRTGDELVFRLVDEWFINMDWRDEIMAVTDQIRWLPDSIQGGEREREWLTNMRDWMISKKRYWGLALPIWINPDEPTDFEVIGSLAELKQRAVEGWNEFEGHTPHKPWIDKVKIRSQKTGAVLSRIVDVGNPWLDAGIVSFSTMGFNSHPDLWKKWYPADLVTECFPGQFRNWFYSLLSMATMMNHDRTDDPDQKKPFKTLLGHRLVMNEAGKPMHKSDGTAIWFEEAAEQIGVDTMRWMYLQQNPASDLRFGTRHPDQPVTLQAPNGPTDVTIDGVKTRLVTSTPADETRRMVLIPLWNSYAFFVNYARLDEFDPLPVLKHLTGHPADGYIDVAERPEIDRWILSNLQALTDGMRTALENYSTPEACRLAAAFVDDLSNWYIRRNRRRFWRSKDASDTDKLAAYQTLYEVLVTLTRLLAPLIPFLSERMYQNLVGSAECGTRNSELNSPHPTSFSSALRAPSSALPESVHLCSYPVTFTNLLDAGLNARMATAQAVVTLGHKLRDTADQRVRQPLAELRVSTSDVAARDAISQLSDVIREELNVKELNVCDSLSDIVKYTYKANLKTLGPKYGKLLNVLREKLPTVDSSLLSPLRSGESVTITLDGHQITLAPEDVQIGTEQATGWVSGDDRGIQLALSTTLTPALLREGMARDFIRQVQQLRKDANLEIEDRIVIHYATNDADVLMMITEWGDLIRGETLADRLNLTTEIPADAKSVNVGDAKVSVWIEKASVNLSEDSCQ